MQSIIESKYKKFDNFESWDVIILIKTRQYLVIRHKSSLFLLLLLCSLELSSYCLQLKFLNNGSNALHCAVKNIRTAIHCNGCSIHELAAWLSAQGNSLMVMEVPNKLAWRVGATAHYILGQVNPCCKGIAWLHRVFSVPPCDPRYISEDKLLQPPFSEIKGKQRCKIRGNFFFFGGGGRGRA